MMKLSNNVELPAVGLGTFLMADDSKLPSLIRAALEAGYRHFDTAIAYNNHKMIGETFKTIFAEQKYKREDIFIVTKIFPNYAFNAI
jgi:diketogulonate reductase-like aldo/keto reductase